MELKNQVCNAELAMTLKTLGIEQKSKFYWKYDEEYPESSLLIDESEIKEGSNVENCSAFTVAELGVLLLEKVKKYSVYRFPDNIWNGRDENGTAEAENEADLRALMLIRAIS